MLEEIEQYAKDNHIPIMQKDGIDYLCQFIKDNNIHNILEIGTAIGYSAIKMALVDPKIKITTIEKDALRYQEAQKNISKFNFQDRIDLIFGDALETTITNQYDLLFIDASKGHNTDFFNKYQKNLLPTGYIITDNLSFHGLVEDETLIKTKNQRGIVKKIKNFITFLDTNPDYSVRYVEVGDKIAICQRKSS